MPSTALITGASSGIGLEFARLMAAQGIHLVLVARRLERMQELKSELEKAYPINVLLLKKDLASAASAEEIYQEVKSHGKTIDYLINNAGCGCYGPFDEAPWEKTEAMIHLNLVSLTHLTHLFLRDMKRQGHGKILNTASTAAFLPGPLMAVYYASKAYVLSFSEALSNEAKGSGVTVTVLCPGPTASEFQAAAAMEHARLVRGRTLPTAREAAEYGTRAMMNGKTVAIPGFGNKAMVYALRFLPRSWLTSLARMIQESKTAPR